MKKQNTNKLFPSNQAMGANKSQQFGSKYTITNSSEDSDFWKVKQIEKEMKNKKEISKPSIRLFTIQKQESQRKLKELQSLNCVSQNLSKEHFITDSSTNDSPKFCQTKVISKAKDSLNSTLPKTKRIAQSQFKVAKNVRYFHSNEKTPYNWTMRCRNCLSANHPQDMLCPLVKTCKNIESKIKASIYGAIEVKSTHAFFSKLKSNCSNDCQKVPVSQDNFYFTQQETSPETIKQLALKLEDDRENELLQFCTTNKDCSSFEKYNESQKDEYSYSGESQPESAAQEGQTKKKIEPTEKEIQEEDKPVHSFFQQKVSSLKTKNPFITFHNLNACNSNLSHSSSEAKLEETENKNPLKIIELIDDENDDVIEITQSKTPNKATSGKITTMAERFDSIYTQGVKVFCCPKCGEAQQSLQECKCLSLIPCEPSSSIKSQSNNSECESDYEIKTWDKKKTKQNTDINESEENSPKYQGTIFKNQNKISSKNFFAKSCDQPNNNSDDYNWGSKNVRSKFDDPKNLPW